MSDTEVLVHCARCGHPRHGHALKRRRRGQMGEVWTWQVRTYCTMRGPDGNECSCNEFVDPKETSA